MTYAAVATAAADVGLTGRVLLALRDRAYARISVVANNEDQRELSACARMFSDVVPTAWVTMVLLALDEAGTLGTATDAELDTAIVAVWNRIKLTG